MTAPSWLVPSLAAYGALVSTGAAVWGIASWVLSGARAYVELSPGLGNEADRFIKYAAKRRGDPDAHLQNLGRYGMAQPLVLVVIRNRGRLQLTVENASLENATGESYGTIGGPEIGPSFPIRLDPGQATVLGYRRDGVDMFVAAARKAHGGEVLVLPVVDLGTGERVRGRTSLLFRSPSERDPNQ